MKITISNKIIIEGCDERLLKPIKTALTIENPDYQMAMRMAAKDSSKRSMMYTVPKSFKYYKEYDDRFIVSRGLKDRLLKYFDAGGVQYKLKEEYSRQEMSKELEEKIVLRDYQKGDTEKILKKNEGIIKLGTGYGKTIIALKLAEETGLKTLIVCCKSEASELAKYKSDFKDIYNKTIGIIQGDNYDVKDVTVATMSTLIRRDLKCLSSQFGLVIFDECHGAMSDKRKNVVEALNPLFKYGMSGTPTRAKGQSESVKFLFGPIIIDKKLPQDKPDVHVYKTNCECGASEYYEMEEKIIFDCERNNIIDSITTDLAKKGRKILILTKRIDHGKILELALQAKFKTIALSSKDKASMRNELIQALRDESKDFQVLIGTYSLLSVGLDLVMLDTVILGMSVKVDGEHNATLVQAIGRALRLYDKKQKPLIIDLDDNKNKIMHRHFKSREKVYKENNFTVIYK